MRRARSWRIDYDGPGLWRVRPSDSRPRGRLYFAIPTKTAKSPGCTPTEGRPRAADTDLGPNSVERILGAPLALLLASTAGTCSMRARSRSPGAPSPWSPSPAAASRRSPPPRARPACSLGGRPAAVRLGAEPAALPTFRSSSCRHRGAVSASPPGARPLSAIVAFGHGATRLNAPSPSRRGGRCLVLVRATVAARLFDRELLDAHFAAAAAATRHVAVWELRFPSGVEACARHLALKPFPEAEGPRDNVAAGPGTRRCAGAPVISRRARQGHRRIAEQRHAENRVPRAALLRRGSASPHGRRRRPASPRR